MGKSKRQRVEYVWLDGKEGLPQVRSKTRFLDSGIPITEWNFDGGSTQQGTLQDSDRCLNPIQFYEDPFKEGGKLVLCEVKNYDGTPHESNTRSVLEKNAEGLNDPWVGFEQEFTLFNPANNSPLGFLLQPKEQGQYYCGVGCLNVIGRFILDNFEDKCVAAGLDLDGINAEVMPGQWEFQTRAADPLKACDDLWMARYILERVCEGSPAIVSYDPKPHPDFNGAGCHTNFSTEEMRNGVLTLDGSHWQSIFDALERDHKKHLTVCGKGTKERLTGECETSSYDTFTCEAGDRGASIRIPTHVDLANGFMGYFEDRRPSANIDPYRVVNSLLTTMKGVRLLKV